MIDAKDLRIGNWINLSLRQDLPIYGKVLSIGSLEQEFEQVYCECEESFEWAFKDNYTGIPLTPEILEKCGFERGIKSINEGLELQIDFYKNSIDARITLLDNFDGDRSADIIETKYLHELQNLYYALTKQELNYQP